MHQEIVDMNKARFLTEWNPREYLNTFYQVVEPDELETIKWVTAILKQHVHTSPRTLMYGVGPALKDIIPIAPYASEIDVTDFVPANLEEIQQWVTNSPTLFSWTQFVRYTLTCEGAAPTDALIAQREALIRSKIQRYIVSDADHIEEELQAAARKNTFRAPYDLVVSMYCIDSSTDNKAIWKQRMRNISRLVAPGGLFITAALGNTHYYDVGKTTFPSAKVTGHDLAETLKLDFSSETVRVEERQVVGHGFSGIVLALAKKPS